MIIFSLQGFNVYKELAELPSKDTINRVKRHPKEWEKIFANHISDKRLKSKSIKNSYNLAITKSK